MGRYAGEVTGCNSVHPDRESEQLQTVIALKWILCEPAALQPIATKRQAVRLVNKAEILYGAAAAFTSLHLSVSVSIRFKFQFKGFRDLFRVHFCSLALYYIMNPLSLAQLSPTFMSAFLPPQLSSPPPSSFFSHICFLSSSLLSPSSPPSLLAVPQVSCRV